MISDFKHQVRKALDDFVKQSAKEELTKDQRRSLDRSHQALLRLMQQGEDANAILHTMLGLLAAMVMKTVPVEQEENAKADVLEAFSDYLDLHVTEKKSTASAPAMRGITRH